MLKIKISDTEFEYLKAIEKAEYFDDVKRRTLTVTCAQDAIDLTVLNSLLSAENLASIQLYNDEQGVTDYFDGYTIKLAVGIVREQVEPEDDASAAVYADRIVFKLGRVNFREVDAEAAAAAAERAEAQATYTAMMTNTLLEV